MFVRWIMIFGSQQDVMWTLRTLVHSKINLAGESFTRVMSPFAIPRASLGMSFSTEDEMIFLYARMTDGSEQTKV